MAGFLDTLNSMFGGGAQQTPPFAPPMADPNTFQDPLEGMSFIRRMGIGLGGIDSVNNFRQQQFDMQQSTLKQNALRDIAAKMENGELDQKSALIEYARRTGDYSKMFQADTTPSAIREYEYVNRLSPEEQALYFKNKRASQIIDRGDAQLVLDPVTGKPGQVIAKGVSPDQQPELKGEQARAAAEAQAAVERDTTAQKKTTAADDTLNTIAEAEKYLNDATGSYGGAAKTFVTSRVLGESTDASKANAQLKVISGKLVSAMPRMEGPQSDKDVQLYKEMAANIADPSIPAEDKKAALDALKGLQAKYASQNQPAPATPAKKTTGGGPKVIDFGAL